MDLLPDSGPMRILQVSPSYAPCIGGAERLLQAVSEGLVTRGHEVTVVTYNCATQNDFRSRQGAGLPKHEVMQGVHVRRIPPDGGRLGRTFRWWMCQRGGWRTTQWMIGSDFHFKLDRPSGVGVVPRVLLTRADVVLSVNWHFGVSFWTSATMRFRRTPHVGVPIFHIDRPWAQREDYSRMLQRCDAVIALTESEASFVRARGGGSVSVGGGGIDPARFSNANGASIRSKYGLGARSVVGFVGRQDEDKGVPTLIRAMVQVWQQAPETVLLLAGPSAHRSPVVTDLLRSLPESSRGLVVLVDDFSDQEGPAILSACEVVAQPSVEEAFGLALIEAWICGRPVIGADIAATRCLIDHGVDGWIVKPLDPLDLAERILDLLGNRDRRESFGTKGREKVLARYTWDRIIDSWEATCRDVLKGRSG